MRLFKCSNGILINNAFVAQCYVSTDIQYYPSPSVIFELSTRASAVIGFDSLEEAEQEKERFYNFCEITEL